MSHWSSEASVHSRTNRCVCLSGTGIQPLSRNAELISAHPNRHTFSALVMLQPIFHIPVLYGQNIGKGAAGVEEFPPRNSLPQFFEKWKRDTFLHDLAQPLRFLRLISGRDGHQSC
ncbi:hypothetical protein Ddc_07485 [Ditylenchus destructor]|nr:hypothetical protein Ddc_07485 [Ditylenchus destructor]